MSASNPLHVLLACAVTHYLPNLSFSNPPLLLWFHKSIFFRGALRIKHFLISGLILMTVSLPVSAQPTNPSVLSFAVSMAEGGSSKSRYSKALELWLEQRQCWVSVEFESENSEDWDLRFQVVEARLDSAPSLSVTLPHDNALDSVWLVRKSSKTGGLASIAKERIGLLSPQSKIGYQIPLSRLEGAGVPQHQVHITHADLYQGLMVLLLHGDVYAVPAPRVLAESWLAHNPIAIVDVAAHTYHAGVWGNSASPDQKAVKHCLQQMSGLTRQSRRDMKMKVFPEWVNGFVSP